MSDFSVRSESVDVEQIMRQIRSRIREKRGVDYTEEEIRELANVKLEKFIDPKGVRSGLLEEYRRVSTPAPPAPNYAFGEDTLYETHRGPIRWIRSLFRPFLKMLFNPNPLIQALHIQADLNQRNAERWAKREQLDALHYEVVHNLVVEVTRSTLEVKSLKMRLESMASRLDFDERRARALEGVVQYRPGTVPPLQPPTGQDRGRQDHRRDQGPRHDGQRHQGPRPQQGQGGQGPSAQGPSAQGPAAQNPGAQSPGAQSQPGQPAPDAANRPGGNAFDNDGNERRSRRRRRRGRRRGGEGDARREAGGAAREAGSESHDAPGGRPEVSEVQGPAVEVAAREPAESGDRASHLAPRAADSEGASGGAGDSSAPPDRAES
jgi:hypothetical protein